MKRRRTEVVVTGLTRNQLDEQSSREFESHRLRFYVGFSELSTQPTTMGSFGKLNYQLRQAQLPIKEVTMKGWVYILKCSDDSYYTGSTNNLERRLEQHNQGEGANHTKNRLPVKLIYFEEYSRIDKAFYREKQIQSWSRKKKVVEFIETTCLLNPLTKPFFITPQTSCGDPLLSL